MKVKDLICELENINPDNEVMIAVIPNKAFNIGKVTSIKKIVYLSEGNDMDFIPKSTVKKLGWENFIHPEILDGLQDE